MTKEQQKMKNYHHCVVMQDGTSYRENVTTNKTAKEQGEKLWNSIANVFLVQVNEDLGECWGQDRYIRNVN